MTHHAWNNYFKYAFDDNELRPLSRKGYNQEIFGTSKGATLIDSIDTFWIMGMIDEFNFGRNWIDKHFSLFSVNSYVKLFEIVIRHLGALLSCYALTNDNMFLLKAYHVGIKLLPAFETESGLPNTLVNPHSCDSKNYWGWSGWRPITDVVSLATIGSLQLEFTYLSDLTGDMRFKEKVLNIRKVLNSKDNQKYNGLYPTRINTKTGRFENNYFTIGGGGDSHYEYLIKKWIQSDKTDSDVKEMFDKTIKTIEDNLIQKSYSGLTYIADKIGNSLLNRMSHLACFSGGMFALSAQSTNNIADKLKFTEYAEQITETCHKLYNQTATKLGPEEYHFSKFSNNVPQSQNSEYLLRPEVIESYFYMWRLTHHQKYRDYAWEAAQAIDHYCRVESGFAGLRNVYNANVSNFRDDVQHSFFIAETLKYLYLIFSNDDLISLDHWVFNTEAHPLPIKNKNPAYILS